MKLVTAVLKGEQLPAVKRSLFESQIVHLTATTVLGTASRTEQRKYRGVDRKVSLFQRVRIEVAVTDSMLETAIDAISRGAMESGGSGKIFVTELQEAITIWTGERGPRTLA